MRGYLHETLSGNPIDPGRDARLILSALAEGKRLTLSSFANAGDCPVGLSNILDSKGREDISGSSPVKRTHGAGVASTLVGS